MPVTPVCIGDEVEISLTYLSLMGTMQLTGLVWQKALLDHLPDQSKIRDYNRAQSMTPDRNKLQKYFADLSRVCDVEDAVNEWFDKRYYEMIATDCLKQHIKH